MSFLDDVRRCLDRPEGSSWALSGLGAHRKTLLDALEALEARGEPEEKIERLHDVWSDKLGAFVQEMQRLLEGGLAFGANATELHALVDVALRRRLGLSDSAGSRIRDRELDRLSSEVLFSIQRPERTPNLWPERYALEVRALRRAESETLLTPIGRLVLGLPERDAVRWLLAVEVAQSRGPSDPWRLSRGAAARLVAARRLRVFWYGSEVAAHPQSLDRLAALGLLSFEDEAEEALTTYELTENGAELLAEVASGDTPMVLLAGALIQDETAAVLGRIRAATALIQRESAAFAMTRHARMVAHEIRNALVPVREAIDDLFASLQRDGRGTLVDRHGATITGGVDRIFRFMTEMAQVVERAGPPPEPFDIAAAIEDALAALAEELGRVAFFDRPRFLPHVRGRRDRFVLAIVDLLRNAARARDDRPAEIRVAAALDGGGAIVVTVDDDGPGVPPEYRKAIFAPGFSLRPGGTGQGLALVREVARAELGGEAHCEESPLGGARFVLRLPVDAGRSAA
ncbi:sensor histidine kinase [Polyangium jinanense]|uniref:histidine kinase n=1 Tax=Polyangium jinanense TaxID=2829994 RepID=A0A9X3X201_9BACT|nr:sensor histidine kinase [Polyangium jinanense]MDC3954742.1 sensor histidine kinase [Polyangium jinanense]MDC3961910.1 sensor histidine kinase [Polyangium jinanense]MDC3981045.1 sensor histidine kinase [Polyangium jinanense]